MEILMNDKVIDMIEKSSKKDNSLLIALFVFDEFLKGYDSEKEMFLNHNKIKRMASLGSNIYVFREKDYRFVFSIEESENHNIAVLLDCYKKTKSKLRGRKYFGS